MEKDFSEASLNKQISALNQDKIRRGTSMSGQPWEIEYDLTHLMTDYLTLVEEEKLFKKATKNGYSAILIITDGFHMTCYSLPANYMVFTDEQLKETLKDQIAEASKEMFKNEEIEVKIYRSLDDFQVGDSINIDKIRS